MSGSNKSNIIQAEIATDEALTSIPAGVILEIQRNATVSYISSGLSEITGLKSKDVLRSDVYTFLEKLLDPESCRQLIPLITQVLAGTRKYLESSVRAVHPITQEPKLYNLQVEAIEHKSHKAIILLHDFTRYNFSEKIEHNQFDSTNILEEGSLVLIQADTKFNIKNVCGNSYKLLGLYPHQLENKTSIWNQLILPEDREQFKKVLTHLKIKRERFCQEIRFINQATQETSWILLNAVPIFEGKELLHWEGYALDISHKKKIESRLFKQSRRLHALYEVSSSLQDVSKPEVVAIKGLKALIKATNSKAGLIWNKRSGTFEVYVTHGLNLEDVNRLNSYQLQDNNLIDYIKKSQFGMVIQNLSIEASNYQLEFLEKDYASLIAVPILQSKDQQSVVGLIFLLSEEGSHYSNDDLDLIEAGGGQIIRSILQARYLDLEKKQANSIKLLYQISKRMTKIMTPEEAGEVILPLIFNEFKFKRIWLGLINSSGTHLKGIAGLGSGMRKRITNVQLELDLNHEVLDHVISSKKPAWLNPKDSPECSGLNLIITNLRPDSVLLIPMLSLGQLVGIIAVEPRANFKTDVGNQIPLLSAIANEMATGILCRRIDSQMASSNKMKMADLLTSGVAHNFNNLLQAVIGQASLIQSRAGDDQKLVESSRSIIESASQGAELIKKMYSYSDQETAAFSKFDLAQFINDSKSNFQQIVHPQIKLILDNTLKQADFYGDYFKIQEIINQLLVNASEACVRSKGEMKITIQTGQKRVLTGEVSTELPPGNYYFINIIDTGAGMEEEQLARCFEPFFTTKNFDETTGVSYTGAGLSLSYAYNLVKKHNGIIIANSTLGQGSTFSVYLPVYKGAGSKTDSEQETYQESLAIIIGLNNEANSKVSSLLESINYNVLSLKSRSEIISYFAIPDFSPRLLVFDVSKANIEIIDYLKILRERFSALKMVCIAEKNSELRDLLRYIDNLKVIDHPLDLIELHHVLKEFIREEDELPLIDKIEIERNASGQQKIKETMGSTQKPGKKS